MKRYATQQARFWAKVEKTETCWLWSSSLTPGGYALFRVGETKIPAHRWAYEQSIGPIPAGLQIDHLCRVRHCVNPSHLEPVTARQNVLRGEGLCSVNAHKTSCIHGHEFTATNTYIRTAGGRRCRMCHRISENNRYARIQQKLKGLLT